MKRTDKKSTEVPSIPEAASLEVSPGVSLDGHRALWHAGQGWLAVADLHLGYARRRQELGGLWPDWGDEQVEATMVALLRKYQPERLILCGDIADGAASVRETREILSRLSVLVPQTIYVRGNHDRKLASVEEMTWVETHSERADSEEWIFFHGDRLTPLIEAVEDSTSERIHTVQGHIHPAVRLDDGAGTRSSVPALLERTGSVSGKAVTNWVMPAFTQWSSGGAVADCAAYSVQRTWACHPKAVLPVV